MFELKENLSPPKAFILEQLGHFVLLLITSYNWGRSFILQQISSQPKVMAGKSLCHPRNRFERYLVHATKTVLVA